MMFGIIGAAIVAFIGVAAVVGFFIWLFTRPTAPATPPPASARATLRDFSVHPLFRCGAGDVEVNWEAVAESVTLTADPPVAGLGSIGGRGPRTVRVERSTRFTMEARNRDGSVARAVPQAVQVFRPGETMVIGGLADRLRCEMRQIGGRQVRVWVAVQTLPPADWPPSIQTDQLVVPPGSDAREVQVRAPDGRVFNLLPGGPVEVSPPVAMLGTWELIRPLAVNEICPDEPMPTVADFVRATQPASVFAQARIICHA